MTSTVSRRTSASLPDLEGVPRVSWEQLGPEFIDTWGRPGGRVDPEHLSVYGKNGSGKTAFVLWALDVRNRLRGSHVVCVLTKPTDKTFATMGWKTVTSWPPNYGDTIVVYAAGAKGLSAEHRAPQRVRVKKLMDSLWRPNSNTIVYWDELTYIEQGLKLKTELETFYREGRTLGITNVASMQRPAYVTRLAHSESGWTVAFPPKDVDDAKRVAEILGDRRRYMAVMAGLDRTRHEFLIIHDRSGAAYISHLPPQWAPGPHSGAVPRGR
jgi:hypothetical protein